MTPTDSLTTLFNHHLWANERLFAECAALTDDQLDTALDGTFGTIRETLAHIVGAERSYFSRISTGRRYQGPNDASSMTADELMATLQTTGRGLVEWAPQVSAEDMVEIDWDGTMRQVPKTILLTQAINHATEHRSQIMSIMTQLGIEPP